MRPFRCRDGDLISVGWPDKIGNLSSPRPSSAAETAPPTLPEWKLLHRIGSGAYGEVWLGRNLATGARRAVKIVYRATFTDERPFNREFEGIKKFEAISHSHPSQLALFHVGKNDSEGYFYYVMELADALQNVGDDVRSLTSNLPEKLEPPHVSSYKAHTLRADLENGRLPAARVLEIALALTEALAHLHANGLIHRDIKPSNIIFVGGRPKLADIGLVTDSSNTRSIVGTESYLAPEGLEGQVLSDVVAIAAGYSHSVALKADGTLVSWGQLPDRNGSPLPVNLSSEGAIKAISAKGFYSAAIIATTAPGIRTLPTDQSVNEWQRTSFTVTETGYPLSYQWRKDGVDIAGATNATYKLTLVQADQEGSYTVVLCNFVGSVTSAPPATLTVNAVAPGAVVVWGGEGYVTGTGYPEAIVPVEAQTGVVAIAAGPGYMLALKANGSVIAWDTVWDGFQHNVPVSVPPEASTGIIAIAAGIAHCLALKNDGSVIAWGRNDSGEASVPLAAANGVAAIAAGHALSFAVKTDGTVLMWGKSLYGATDLPQGLNGVMATVI